jgi:uncharacterized membrane protein YebE (DUF533 family)
MALLKLAALGALGYAGYRYYQKQQGSRNSAFAYGQAGGSNFSQVRDAGPESMADTSKDWTKTDQASDESFPASDPPGNY